MHHLYLWYLIQQNKYALWHDHTFVNPSYYWVIIRFVENYVLLCFLFIIVVMLCFHPFRFFVDKSLLTLVHVRSIRLVSFY